MAIKVADLAALAIVAILFPVLKFVGRYHHQLRHTQRFADFAGFQVRSTHYYEPTYAEADLPVVTSNERDLPGLDLNRSGQLALLSSFGFSSELREVPLEHPDEQGFWHMNPSYQFADAESLYSMIRLKRPKRLYEIGSGNSTRMARLAIDANRDADPAYKCEHICIEPYEMDWLEGIGVEVFRKKIEDVPIDMFLKLEKDDILFIDSSHVIRPYGDVLREYLQIVPRLRPGVLVHVHDIFTPRDYPEAWLREERRLWNEQYLLEAFLSFSERFEVVLALNWLKHNHFEGFSAAFPRASEYPDHEPGAFWFQVLDQPDGSS